MINKTVALCGVLLAAAGWHSSALAYDCGALARAIADGRDPLKLSVQVVSDEIVGWRSPSGESQERTPERLTSATLRSATLVGFVGYSGTRFENGVSLTSSLDLAQDEQGEPQRATWRDDEGNFSNLFIPISRIERKPLKLNNVVVRDGEVQSWQVGRIASRSSTAIYERPASDSRDLEIVGVVYKNPRQFSFSPTEMGQVFLRDSDGRIFQAYIRHEDAGAVASLMVSAKARGWKVKSLEVINREVVSFQVGDFIPRHDLNLVGWSPEWTTVEGVWGVSFVSRKRFGQSQAASGSDLQALPGSAPSSGILVTLKPKDKPVVTVPAG
ncbi:MAG: hypothetical protein AB7G93_17910 [Bdellovibrionales bacterium]